MVWKEGGGNHLAKSLVTLYDQADAVFPGRKKGNDGSIGDEAHRARVSDHNPNENHTVTALDITHDPSRGFDAGAFAESLRLGQDHRILNVIFNGRIFSSEKSPWVWRARNKGPGDHSEHVHISVKGDPALADDAGAWVFKGSGSGEIGPIVGRPKLKRDDRGPAVADLQRLLGFVGSQVDEIFGQETEDAVIAFQNAHDIEVDGIVGSHTWGLLTEATPAPAPVSSAALSPEAIARIVSIAGSSTLASVNWKERGRAPIGYIKGMAVTFAKVYLDLKAGKSSALAMTAPLGSPEKDALAWYGVTGLTDRAAVLRALVSLEIGLGMRESSGKYYEGRDASAKNTDSDTAEAGLFQQSFNSFAASKELPKLFDTYTTGSVDGFISIFREGLSGSPGSGSGDGAQGLAFQSLCKSKPAFAVECAAVGLRVLRQHWGPINRREVELRSEADTLLQQVQQVVDAVVTAPIKEPIIIPPKKPGEPTPQPMPAPAGNPALLLVILLLMMISKETKMPDQTATPPQGLDLGKLLLPLLLQSLVSGKPINPNDLLPELLKGLTGQPIALPPPVVDPPPVSVGPPSPQAPADLGSLLLPLLLQMLTGKPVTLPAPTAPKPDPTPKAPVAPVVDPAKPPLATTPSWLINLSAAATAIIAGLGLGSADVITTPVGPSSGIVGQLWPLVSAAGGALGVYAPIVRVVAGLFSRVKITPPAKTT